MPRDPRRELLYLADIVESARTVERWLAERGGQWDDDEILRGVVELGDGEAVRDQVCDRDRAGRDEGEGLAVVCGAGAAGSRDRQLAVVDLVGVDRGWGT